MNKLEAEYAEDLEGIRTYSENTSSEYVKEFLTTLLPYMTEDYLISHDDGIKVKITFGVYDGLDKMIQSISSAADEIFIRPMPDSVGVKIMNHLGFCFNLYFNGLKIYYFKENIAKDKMIYTVALHQCIQSEDHKKKFDMDSLIKIYISNFARV